MVTTRLGLVNKGEIVLIGEKYEWSAFQVQTIKNDYVVGIWLSDNTECNLYKGLPTKPLTQEWVTLETIRLNNIITDKKEILQKLQKLYR